MIRHIATIALFLAACGSCLDAPVAVNDPMRCDATCRQTAQRFDAPAFYADLWASVEVCAGATGDWRAVRWFVHGQADSAAGSAVFVNLCPDYPGGCAGRWDSPHDIHLNRWDAFYAYPGKFQTVRHEILHDLLQDGSHAAPAWTACHLI